MDNDDEIWDKLWAELAVKQYSSSEWEFQEVFALAVHDDSLSLEVGQSPEHLHRANNEGVVAVDFDDHSQQSATGHLAPPPPPPPNVQQDSEEYRAYLMSRLQFECAAVSLFRAKRVEPDNTEAINVPQLNLYKGRGPDPLNVQEDASVIIFKKSPEETNKCLTSRSHLDGLHEAQTTQTDDAKRKPRRLQNQESARRSRRRKAEERISLEARVDQLRQEKSNLLKQLSNIIHKRNEEAAHYKVLETHVATLRAQVNMLEEMVRKAITFSYPSDIPAPTGHSKPNTL